MTDRELLELAAKAAKIDWIKDCVWIENGFYSPLAKHERISWNPLTDDGDALRLVVKLRLAIEFDWGTMNRVYVDCTDETNAYSVIKYMTDDPCDAVRRAIVTAAAEIGRNMT